MFHLKEKVLPLATVDCCLRKWKKIISTSQINSCPPVKLCFLWKLFSSNSNDGFHKYKNNSDQKTMFPLDRKSVCTSRMKDLLKNMFLLYGKVAPTLKNLLKIQKIGAHQQEYGSSLIIVSIIVSSSQKN